MRQMIIYACSVCFFGDGNDAQVKGIQIAFIALLSVLALVFTFLIKFFIHVYKRSKGSTA